MTNIVPQWRRSAERLRDNVLDTIDRWRPTRRDMIGGQEGGSPVRFGWEDPSIDMRDDGNAIRVSAELPGMDSKDFVVNVEADKLILRGEKKAEHEEKNENYYYSECRYGSFYRAIPLPCKVDAEQATAEYKRGVLHVRLPKTEDDQSRRIEVTVH